MASPKKNLTLSEISNYKKMLGSPTKIKKGADSLKLTIPNPIPLKNPCPDILPLIEKAVSTENPGK